MATPLTSIAYRIQNVDFQTYIEMPDITPGNAAELRPLKDTNRQQWYLEPDSKGASFYHIRSAITDDTLYLGYMSTYLGYHRKANIVSLSFQYNQDLGTYTLLYGTTVVSASSDHRKLSYNISPNSLDNQRWKLIPVTVNPIATLTSGYYRIRTLGGPFSLTMSRAPGDGSAMRPQVYVANPDTAKGDQYDHQRWLITRGANGRYTLKNSGRGLYMFCDGAQTSRGDTISASTAEYEWDIQSTGGSMWSIRLPLPSGKDSSLNPLSLGFADGEPNNGDLVSLQSSDFAKSQTWFFEKYVTLSADKVQANREVPSGVYRIRNCRDTEVYVAAKGGNDRGWEIVGAQDVIYKFELKYVDDTAKFTLQYVRGANEAKVPVNNSLDMLVCDGVLAEFVLFKNNGNDPGYYICPADSSSMQKTVTTRVKKNIFSAKSGLAVDPRVDGDTSQMWTFQ